MEVNFWLEYSPSDLRLGDASRVGQALCHWVVTFLYNSCLLPGLGRAARWRRESGSGSMDSAYYLTHFLAVVYFPYGN